MTDRETTWPMRPIGDLLKRVSRPVDVKPDTTYREIGIRSHCKGIFHKPETTGKKIGNKRVFWVEPGCLVFNIIFAWEQAVAMTSDAESGMIASHRFPMYQSRNGKLLPEYAWRYFSTPRGKYDLNIASPGGAGRNKTLGQEEFKRLKIPVPPVEHQRRALNILSTVDRAMERSERLIAAKRKLKKGLAQQLLTGKRRLPGFGEPAIEGKSGKESKCGWIPSDWECVHLRDIARLNPDTLPESTPPDYSFWYIDLSMVKQGVVDFPDEQIRFEDAPSRARRAVSKGDITMATVRPNLRGYAYWPDEVDDVVCSTGFAVIRVTEASAQFVYQWLYSTPVARYFYGCIAGTGYPALNPGDVENMAVPCPPRDEQKRIAEVLGAADRAIALLEKKLAALSELKRGLMQKLLTTEHLKPMKGA
ncbi:MAG: hypothetical protein Kow00105_15860 [Phycisphaeraceae bacterium]